MADSQCRKNWSLKAAPLGSTNFVEQDVQAKVAKWVDQLDWLTVIAQSDPQAAYSAHVHSFQNSWIYLARCVPGIGDLLKPLEEVLEKCFIPALTSHNPNEATRDLLALPVRLGGLGLANPAKVAESEFRDSSALSAKLTAALLMQLGDQSDLEETHRPKGVLHQRKREEQAVSAQDVFNRLSPELQRYVTIACEKGASSWLTALPLQDHGFSLSKGTFRDAIRLRYGWSLHNLPSEFVCGKPFSADHALNCKIGGYPCIRHNQVRDLLASLMKEVCTDVRTEPELQPLAGEVFNRATTITTDEARLDIEARGFWECRQECTMFDVRVFNPCADSYRHAPLSTLYRCQEQLRRNAYEERVRQVEKASFVPLVFTTSGSASPAATVILKRLAARLAEARDLSYSTVMGWLRCRLSFCLLRCAVMCFRGSRSRRTTALDNVPNLACSAARVNFSAWVCLFHFVRSTSCFVCLPSFLLSLRLVLWSSLSIACCLSLYLFAIVWCVSSKFYVLWSS